MRTSALPVMLLACLLAGACSESRSTDTALLAGARIGPEGGLLVVDSGSQQGLVLEVPAGAVDQPTEFRVLEEQFPLGDGGQALSGPLPGLPFRIEPIGLVSAVPMRLRAPYTPGAVAGTGAGNVDVRQINPWTTRDYDPVAVDTLEAWVEVSVLTLGRFQVVEADSPEDRSSYVPALGSVALMTGGYTFAVEPEPASSPFVGAEQWAITGPGFDERLIVSGRELVGRRREPATWLEVWSAPYDPFGDPEDALAGMAAQPMQVSAPVNQQPVGGTVMPLCYFQFGLPEPFRGALWTDVGVLTMQVAYDRADLGAGERQLVLWLSPDVGLLRLSVDGAVYERIP